MTETKMAAGIEYAEAGEGPAVICLHGIGGDTESFRPQLEGLTGFRVIAWNMPGYGASARAPWPPSFESLSAALGRFAEALGLERAHLVGHSIGGMVALEHAVRRPDQVASLTIIGSTPAFGGRDDSFKRAFLEARLKPLEDGMSMAEMAEASAPDLAGPIADAACIASVVASMARVSEETWRGILECLVTFDRREALAGLDLPACLIAGSEDRNAPARTMERMAQKMPRAEFHVIEGAGHMIELESPDQVNAIIAAFLEKVETGARG